jgi:hypothetical protein
MTTSIAVNGQNRIFLDANGNLALVSGLPAVMQNCMTAMRVRRGEMMYAANGGVPFQEAIWDTFNPKLFEAAARGIIQGVSGVLPGGVLGFTMQKQGNNFYYLAVIQTIYGTGVLVNDAANLQNPGNVLDYNFILDQSQLG